MRLSDDAIIANEKVTGYLLKWRVENDKSKFLALAGYDLSNWEQLITDIRQQILPLDASLSERTPYGDMYEIRGALTGPNGAELQVVTIWMIEKHTNITKFITLFPDKEF
jgi:hypothetical protein